MSNDLKKRYWAFVLYPDSAPSDWREILQLRGMACAVSPLHDKDLNATGEIKKPHYHVILCFNGPTTFNSVSKLTVDSLNATIPQPLESIKGYYRYLTHKDNPEKAQYADKDILLLNGFNVLDYFDLSSMDKARLKVEVLEDILKFQITEYSELCLYYAYNDLTKFDLVSTHTIFFNRFLTSRRCSNPELALTDKELVESGVEDIEI
ncbi:MAG: replication protein [Clostridiales bacterium]|nr:replication protein [Clostridiales bacterium]